MPQVQPAARLTMYSQQAQALGYRCTTHMCGHIGQHRQTHSTRINTNNDLILYPPLVVQDEGWLVGRHTHTKPPTKKHHHQKSGWPQLLGSGTLRPSSHCLILTFPVAHWLNIQLAPGYSSSWFYSSLSSCWHRWRVGPVVWLQLLALRSPHTHVLRMRTHPPGKYLEIEFNGKIGQMVLIRHRAWPDNCSDQSNLLGD